MKRFMLLCLSLSLTGCPKDRIMGGKCAVDADCGQPAGAFRCEDRTGIC